MAIRRLLRAVVALSVMCASVFAQDTVRVHADNPPVWGPNVQLSKMFAIGQVDGPPEYAFGRIDYFASQSDGSFFVYDGKDVQVRWYDATGKLRGKIGRAGDGPGEYRDLMGMAVVGDSLITWDVSGGRLSFFGRDGRFRTARALTLPSYSHGSKIFGVDNQNVVYVRSALYKGSKADRVVTPVYIRFSTTGTAIDTIPLPADDAERNLSVSTADGHRLTFVPQVITTLYPGGGFVQGRTDRYAIWIVSPSGRSRVFEHAFEPVVIQAAERAEWQKILRDFVGLLQLGAARGRTPLSPPFVPPEIPRTKPPFRELRTDQDRRIWVEVHAVAEKRAVPVPSPSPSGAPPITPLSWIDRNTYDVFRDDATFLGRVVLPQRSTLLEARGNKLWVKTVGSDDEETIVAYKIVGRGA